MPHRSIQEYKLQSSLAPCAFGNFLSNKIAMIDFFFFTKLVKSLVKFPDRSRMSSVVVTLL